MKDELTALDWNGVVMAAVGLLWAGLLMPLVFVPRLTMMYADFESRLPKVTLLVILQWPQMVLSAAPAAMLVGALTGERPLGTRRALIVAAFVAGGAIMAGSLVAMYLPIFQIADAVR